MRLSQLFDTKFDTPPNLSFEDSDLEVIEKQAKKVKQNICLETKKNSRNQTEYFIKYDEKEDFVLPLFPLNIPEFAKNLLNSSIAVFGGSKSGKTVFTSYLIYCLMYLFKSDNIGLVIVARTLNSYEKLKNMSDLLSAKMGFSIDFTNVLCVNDPSLLEQLYYAIYEKKVKDILKKGADGLDPNFKDPKVAELPDSCKETLAQFKYFIFYFDDCTDIYCDPTFKSFFNKFPTTHRHANVTVVFNTHSFQHMNVRQNINNFAIAGLASDRVIKLIYESIHLVGVVFQKPSRLTKLLFNKEKFFKNDKTLLIIREPKKNAPQRAVYHYCMDTVFVDKLIDLETKAANEIN